MILLGRCVGICVYMYATPFELNQRSVLTRLSAALVLATTARARIASQRVSVSHHSYGRLHVHVWCVWCVWCYGECGDSYEDGWM